MTNIWSNRLTLLAVAIASLFTFLGQISSAMAEVNMPEVNRVEAQSVALEVEMFNPKRIRPVIDGQTHVRLCLMNTDVHIGCDVPPNGSLDLTFPINGRITLRGKYLLAAQDSDVETSIPGSTDIVLWRQAGDDPAIPRGKLQARAGEPARSFQDYIVTSHITYAGEISTVFSFNISREDAYFGLASDYQDSGGSFVESEDNKLNWSINLRLLKDESPDPATCEFLKMVLGTDDCLVPQHLSLSTLSDDSSHAMWSGLPQLSFVY